MQKSTNCSNENSGNTMSKKGVKTGICIALAVVIVLGAFSVIKIINTNLKDAGQTIDHKNPSDDKNDTLINDVTYKISRENRPYKNKDGQIIIEHYYELVAVDGDSKSINKINLSLKEDMDEFMMDEDELDDYVNAYATPDSPYFNNCETAVTHNSDGLLSLKYTMSWYMGGVSNVDYYGKTYDLHTGENISLNDLVSGNIDSFQKQFKANIWEYLYDNYKDALFPDAKQTIYDMGLDEFDFCIDNNQIIIMFSTYSVGPGIMGAIEYPTGIYINSIEKGERPTITLDEHIKVSQAEITQTEINQIQNIVSKYVDNIFDTMLNEDALIEQYIGDEINSMPDEINIRLKTVIRDYATRIIEKFEYEVKDIDVSGDIATVDVILKYPDFNSINTDFNNMEPSELFTDEELSKISQIDENDTATQAEFIETGLKRFFDKVINVVKITEITDSVSLKKVGENWEIVE